MKEFEKELLRRQHLYFEEIRRHNKFTKAPHAEEKYNINIKKQTFDKKNKEAVEKINEEEDVEKQCDLLKRLNEIVLIEDKEKRLQEIITFVDNIE